MEEQAHRPAQLGARPPPAPGIRSAAGPGAAPSESVAGWRGVAPTLLSAPGPQQWQRV